MKKLLLLTLFSISTLTTTSSSHAKFNPELYFLDYYFLSSEPTLAHPIETALSDRIAEFKEIYGGMRPTIQIAKFDLNYDDNPEIIVRFFEDFHFRDEQNNIETYIFSSTPKGLVKIFSAMAGDIAFTRKRGEHGLPDIRAYKGLTPQYDTYKWDGKREFVK